MEEIDMAYTGRFGQSDDYRREELIRIIEHSVENLTLQELEALYYDMSTKNYINGRSSESRQACLDGRVVTDEDEVNEWNWRSEKSSMLLYSASAGLSS